jgi:predicted dehydrogenase
VSEGNDVSRRDFVKIAGGAAAATLAASQLGFAHSATTQGLTAKMRFAIIGTGHRGSGMWGSDLVERYSDVLDFVGLADKNPKRAEAARQLMGVNCPTFGNCDEMCDKVKPDILMVTTVDGTHVEYITKGLERGLKVITEKPMVTDETMCQKVLDTEKRTGNKIIVTFNYRYAPKHRKIKELIQDGAIGRVTSVDFSWYLDGYHGADYFRRWHRLIANSGSLWVHKATHHFDLMNWWLGADPVEVDANAALRIYGKNGSFRSSHCRACPFKDKCEFYFDLTKDARLMKLYAGECEEVDGYHRDGCVFKEDVNIFDTMSATVRYSNDVMMSYSLNASMPIEGYRVAFNGEKGRLEVRDYERQPWPVEDETEMYLMRRFKDREKIAVPKPAGGHYGGDDILRDLVFRSPNVPDYMRLPDSRAGALACLTGIAARKSVLEKHPVKIEELVKL